MRTLKLFLLCIIATACSSLSVLTVEPDDNAMACVKGESAATGGIFGGGISGLTVELPQSVDTSNYTAEDWKTLSEICD